MENSETKAPRPAWRLIKGRGWVIAAAALIGLGAGVAIQKTHVPHAVVEKVSGLIRSMSPKPDPDQLTVPWQEIDTNKQQIEVASVTFSPVRAFGGAIEQVGDNIVIASPKGHLAYLDAHYRLHPLAQSLPMNLKLLRRSPIYNNVLFNVGQVRVHDLLTIPTGPNEYDLYASFNRYSAENNCFDLVIARLRVEVQGETVRGQGPWTDVWKIHPCVPLRTRGDMYTGEESGGRMVRYGDDQLLVSVGNFQFDGFYTEYRAAMDPASDYGKIIVLSLKRGLSRHMAMGLRNPEGLAVAKDGRIWETEHGPNGGDEVNLIRQGANYGWPIVTYGMSYGSPPTNWPSNPVVGGHNGYALPQYAFVPSIGIGNDIEPDVVEFPNWKSTLLVCSLRAATLYVLRLEGDTVVYAEPIALGSRLRDIISLHDGRLAILADNGGLFLIRNAERHRGEPRTLTISGLHSLPPPEPEELPASSVSGADRGRFIFQNACASCHSLVGEADVGPPLNGVVSRKIASVPGYDYSAGLRSVHHDGWDEEALRRFLENTAAYAPGTRMPLSQLYVAQANDVIAFLKTTHPARQTAKPAQPHG